MILHVNFLKNNEENNAYNLVAVFRWYRRGWGVVATLVRFKGRHR